MGGPRGTCTAADLIHKERLLATVDSPVPIDQEVCDGLSIVGRKKLAGS